MSKRQALPPNAAQRIPLTVIILSKDEAVNIARCLRCLARADDVVIVDSGSSDNTLALALEARLDIRVFVHGFSDFGAQRNWALEHAEPKHDWILFVDADEFCTPELMDEIGNFIARPESYVGAYVAGKNVFLGRWLKYSTTYPSYQVRLLKRGKVAFRKEGHGQREVTDGPLLFLNEGWVHEGFSKGVSQWIDRHNTYSSEEVDLILRLQEEPVVWRELLSPNPILRRRSLKRLAARVPGRPLTRFVYTYFWRRGFLDGVPGLIYSMLQLAHDIHIVAKLRERKHFSSATHSSPEQASARIETRFIPGQNANGSAKRMEP